MNSILSTLRVQVLVAQHNKLGPEWFSAGKIDPYGRLYYVESGEGFVVHENKQYHLKPKHYYAVPAFTWHSYFCPHFLAMDWMHFTAELLGGLDIFDFYDLPWELSPTKPDRIRKLMKQLQRLQLNDSATSELQSMGLLLQLLAPFLEASEPAKRAQRAKELKRFHAVLNYIDSHLHETISIDRLAGLAHLERGHFTRLFKRVFGVPPSKYVMQRRLEQAQQMLWQSDDKLAAIAARLGFTDAFHFSKTFTKFVGMAPSRFRKKPFARMP